MDSGTLIAAAVAAVVFALGLRHVFKGTKPAPPPSTLGLEAIDKGGFDAAMRQQVRADQSRIDARHSYHSDLDTHLNAVIARMSQTPTPAYIHTSDATHARRLVTGIAAQHPLAIFADLSIPDAAEQAAILTDLLSSAGLAPYTVDVSADAALRLGLPLAPDHPAPVVLYVKGVAVGDFIATTDALRLGGLADRLTQASITHDAAALTALQDSLQKA